MSRLDSGSDGESLPGVAGAGQSNLSTGVAALIQDQLINSPQVRAFSPEQDFIEMDFDPGSESDGDSSSDSGQGRDGTDMEGEDREEEAPGRGWDNLREEEYRKSTAPMQSDPGCFSLMTVYFSMIHQLIICMGKQYNFFSLQTLLFTSAIPLIEYFR